MAMNFLLGNAFADPRGCGVLWGLFIHLKVFSDCPCDFLFYPLAIYECVVYFPQIIQFSGGGVTLSRIVLKVLETAE